MITVGDLSAAAESLWTAGGFTTGSVPGGLTSGRAAATSDSEGQPRAMPYAILTVSRDGDQEFYSARTSAGQSYRAGFKVLLEVYGVGRAAVDAVLKGIHATFGQDANWSFSPPEYLVGVWLADDGPKLEQDETQRQGNDIWKGTLAYHVAVGGLS